MSALEETNAMLEKQAVETAEWLKVTSEARYIAEITEINSLIWCALEWCVKHSGECLGDHPDRFRIAQYLIRRKESLMKAVIDNAPAKPENP